MPQLLIVFALALAVTGQDVDEGLRTAVERFFATQAAEDTDAYLALWSRTAKRPAAFQLKYVFDSGNDQFTELEITRAVIEGETARVRGSITRVRTITPVGNRAATPPPPFTSRSSFALAYVREDGDWKLVREGAPVDELAEALIAETDPQARAALLAAEPDLATPRLIDALGRRADPFAQANDFKAAQQIYERAVEAAVLIRDRKTEGLMLQNVANSLYYQRNFPGALTRYEQRLALEREVNNEEGIASALVGAATVKYATFEYSAALALYLEALALQEKLDDQALVATTLISTGNVRYLQGDFDVAIADYRRAETLKRKYDDLAGAAMALEGLGRTYAAQGDYAAAFAAFASLLEDATRRKDLRRQASALSSVGDVHTRLANLDAARTAYDESRKANESVKDPAGAGRALQAIGIVELMAGRFPQAGAAYEKSHASCASAVPSDGECMARALVGLGYAQASQELWDPAIASYRKGIDLLTVLRADEGAVRARVGLAEALIGKGEFVAALIEAGAARDTAAGLGSDDLRWRALVSFSRAQRKLERSADALETARTAVTTVRKMADAALARPAFATPRDVTLAYANLAILHAEAGDAAAAWDAVEEMRARALRNALASNEREISRGMTDEERAAERALASELTALHGLRDRETGLAAPDQERVKRFDAAIAPLTEKRAAAQQQLFARLPDLATWRGLAPAATHADLTPALLDDGQLIVQFVVDDEEVLVVTAQRTGESVQTAAHLVPIERTRLAERVAIALESIPLADGDAWRKGAQDLIDPLLAPVFEQMATAKAVVIIPDEMLWRVPFEALPRPTSYLGDQVPVTYAPSVTAMIRARPEPGGPPAFRIAVVAAPSVPPGVVDSLKKTAPTWTLRAPDAAKAQAARVETVAGVEQVTLVAGDAATEEAVRGAAATASVLHLEGPARVNAASPLFSSLLLVPPPATTEAVPPAQNGVLEAREVPAAGFTTRLTVFADPAALSMRDAAAAVAALHWVWRAGGTETLLVRRWGGDDAAAHQFLAAFYERLKAGASAAAALHAAQETLRESGAPPAAWAAWMMVGAES
jgi:CHAT domain-containing protein